MQNVNNRWKKIEDYLKNYKQADKQTIKRTKKKYYKLCTPFHRQSQEYGIYALQFTNVNNLPEDNRIYYRDDSLKINQYIQIPMYFKRKLFEEQIKINGKRIWQLNENGINYKIIQENKIVEKISDRLKATAHTNNKDYTDKQLDDCARYIYFERGRLKGKNDYKLHLDETTHYNYITNRDEKYLGKKCISTEYAGNDTIGYCTTAIKPDFELEKEIYINNEYEKIIEDLMQEKDTTNLQIFKEHMNDIRKLFFNQ